MLVDFLVNKFFQVIKTLRDEIHQDKNSSIYWNVSNNKKCADREDC